MLRSLYVAAVLLTALTLVPAGAHLLALPNKIALPRDAYLAAQQIYASWALLGVVLLAAVAANLALAGGLRRARAASWPAIAAALLIVATLAIFFVWVYPANQATANWTTMPAGWETLRRQWEYGHAVNAVLTFAALLAVTFAQPPRG